MSKNLDELFNLKSLLERRVITVLYERNDKEELTQVLQEINVTDFNRYAKHFEIIVKVKLGNLDLVTELVKANLSSIDFMEYVPSIFRVDVIKLAQELTEVNRAIQTIAVFEQGFLKVTENNVSEILASVQREIVRLSSKRSSEETAIAPLVDRFEVEQAEYRKLPPGGIIGLSTGFRKIDEVIDGIRAPHLWVIGGYTNVGKSSFALNLLVSILLQGKKVVFYSLEMGKMDIISRLAGIIVNTNGMAIRKGMTSPEIEATKDFLRHSNLKVINEKRDLDQILLSMHEQKMTDSVDVFFLDYLQNVNTTGSDTEYETMKKTSNAFQDLAGKLNVPIITLSQLSNEAAKTPNGVVMGFKGSGTIAATADFAIELSNGEENVDEFRRKMQEGQLIKMNVIIKKNRHGRAGKITLEFNGISGRFLDEEELMDLMIGQTKDRFDSIIHPKTKQLI